MSLPLNIARVSKHASVLSRRIASYPLSTSARLCFATVQPGKQFNGISFTSSSPVNEGLGPRGDPRRPPDERTLKLGKTLRILQERLPTLLQTPLPSEILSPHVTLHLFPSTHPHLPAVSGRVAYVAALWSSPIAWGRIPIVGNVKLEILSERMIKKSSSDSPLNYQSTSSVAADRGEQLVVRWRTLGKTKGKGVGGSYRGINQNEPVDKITEFLAGGSGEDDSREFTGLFKFEFDEEGRVLSHTIEHVQEGGDWEKGVGAKVVGLTDWLLGGMKGRNEPGTPCPCFTGTPPRRS